MLAEVLSQPDAELQRGWGWPQWHHAKRAEVGAELRRGVFELGPLPRWCHEAAGMFAVQHRDRGDVVVIHGAVVERGAPFWHSWCVIGGDTVYDPTTGEFFQRESWDEVLHTMTVCEHDAGEVTVRVAETGSLGPWEGCRRRHAAALNGWLDQLAREHPELDRWVTAMCDREPAFAVAWEELQGPEGLGVLDALAWLADHPQTWRDHPVGRPWPYLGDLQHAMRGLRTERKEP